jgi:hypothetical protein
VRRVQSGRTPAVRTGMGGGARAGLRARVACQGRVHRRALGRCMIRKGMMR